MTTERTPKCIENVRLDKLVHGGQALGTLPEGQKVFVWNALPGEIVDVELTKLKKDYAEGYAARVVKASKHRMRTFQKTDVALSVMPWSIMDYQYELEQKSIILQETFEREGVSVAPIEIQTQGDITQYRNKVEFSFWGDDDGLHYAHYVRASHQKIKLEHPYTELIPTVMAEVAQKLLRDLNEQGIRASMLKSLILRMGVTENRQPKVVSALFVKSKEVPKIDSPNLMVVYSNPKSPASVVTEVLYANGDITLTNSFLGNNITYDVLSFFQVNPPIFERALTDIKEHVLLSKNPVVDMYSGVGSIGIAVGANILVESDQTNAAYARKNAPVTVKVVASPSEKALDILAHNQTVIVDPPRAGLHPDVIQRFLEIKPQTIIYLSCNPITQARDVALVSSKYDIAAVKAYNFFHQTPHIESLVVLELKS